MIINRHNYQEIFLLYVDNELNGSDRTAVESFVQQNPDLAEEFEMLQQSVLTNEEIPFEQKDILYKKEDSITLTNYEEYFVLSVDDELSAGENEEVEKFVLKHPELQDVYILFKQTKLEPEATVFPNKKKLYRKEKKTRIILPDWVKISAAAAIVGITAITWIFIQNNHYSVSNVTVAAKNKSEKGLPEKNIKSPQATVTERDIVTLLEKAHVNVETKEETKVEVAKTEEPKKRNDLFTVNQQKNKVELQIDKTDDDKIETVTQEQKPTEPEIASVKNLNNSNISPMVKNDEPKATFVKDQNNEQDGSIVKHAVYREIDIENEDEEKDFYIGAAEINKNRLKGLFKKAISLFEKKTNKNDHAKTIQIAGFEIKSK